MSILAGHYYLNWQQKLQSDKFFRYWWQVWSNYSAVFFAISFVFVFRAAYFYNFVILSVISFILARGVIVAVINLFYRKIRPYQLYGFVPITSRFFSFKTTTHNSFPSRHTAALASVATTAFLIAPWLGVLLFLVVIMTGIARVILGYHYPEDIFAGLIIGLISAIFSFQFLSIFIFT